jgi:hypothetical protein
MDVKGVQLVLFGAHHARTMDSMRCPRRSLPMHRWASPIPRIGEVPHA